MELLDAVRTQKERTRLMLNNILFATDFSPSSEMALRYALTLARHYHAEIHIIQAVALDSVDAIASGARQHALDEERPFAIRGAKKLLLSGKLDGVRHQVLVGEEGKSVLPTLLHNQAIARGILFYWSRASRKPFAGRSARCSALAPRFMLRSTAN